jgi:WD40 repeat protein
MWDILKRHLTGQKVLPPKGLSRRQFFTSAGASAAGGLLVGCAAQAPSTGGDGVFNDNDYTHRPTCVAVAPGNHAVTSDDDWNVYLWNLGTSPATKLATFKQHVKKASYVAVSEAADRVFSASFDGDVYVSNLTTHAYVGKFSGHRALPPAGGGPKTEVWVVTPSFDGSRALSATNGGEIRLWEVASRTMIGSPYRLPDGHDPVPGLAFVPKNAAATETEFLTTHGNGMMHRWQIGNPNPVKAYPHGNNIPVNAVAVTKDGTTAVTGSFDTRLRVWDVQTGVLKKNFVAHDGWIWRVAISEDGKIASASEDGTVGLFDQTGMELNRITETGGVMGVAFVDNHNIVYTSGSDVGAEVKLWTV